MLSSHWSTTHTAAVASMMLPSAASLHLYQSSSSHFHTKTDSMWLLNIAELFSLPSTGEQWHDTESSRGGVRQHDAPQPQPPSPAPPSRRTSWGVWGLRLLKPTIVIPSWQQKRRAVCVAIDNRPSALTLVLCCHQWKATAKVEHQTCAANKPHVRTVCRHKLDTAFSFSVSYFVWMGL